MIEDFRWAGHSDWRMDNFGRGAHFSKFNNFDKTSIILLYGFDWTVIINWLRHILMEWWGSAVLLLMGKSFNLMVNNDSMWLWKLIKWLWTFWICKWIHCSERWSVFYWPDCIGGKIYETLRSQRFMFPWISLWFNQFIWT